MNKQQRKQHFKIIERKRASRNWKNGGRDRALVRGVSDFIGPIYRPEFIGPIQSFEGRKVASRYQSVKFPGRIWYG